MKFEKAGTGDHGTELRYNFETKQILERATWLLGKRNIKELVEEAVIKTVPVWLREIDKIDNGDS